MAITITIDPNDNGSGMESAAVDTNVSDSTILTATAGGGGMFVLVESGKWKDMYKNKGGYLQGDSFDDWHFLMLRT
eukprot:CAMPEP_0203696074 /NCGR_PEP_ID=MMETSP0091-20130426/7384_1 /ASSEMBLY_ACC=CAM_ASM_001089 /TAXON_ID=426623 /ORGANISM="Chaetoceros affinis, Strain CCMP159" /LENGTH=75 /DNA_ID=CAMNT_0050567781 /DNA_START=73 /DNA_END=297 /DNA_ORIENTATION=+